MTKMSIRKIKQKKKRNLHEDKQHFHMKVTIFMYETVNTGQYNREILEIILLFSSSFNTKMPHFVEQYGYCTFTKKIVNNRSPGHTSLVDYFISFGLGMEKRKTFYYVPHHVSGARRYQIIICVRLNVLMYEYFKYSYPIYSMVFTSSTDPFINFGNELKMQRRNNKT